MRKTYYVNGNTVRDLEDIQREEQERRKREAERRKKNRRMAVRRNREKAMGMSRSSLYSKFKVLIGMNPNEFVLSIRLKHAATLLLAEPHLQIAEVSDRMGFGSPRYFARCFKAQFGVTPADYRKQNQPE